MKNTFFKRSLNFILALVMVICSVPLPFVVAADPTVEIVSFKRGAQTDLRSSELLEARLSNYDGNPQELTYKWTNGLDTYLYAYNSHNMFGINDTSGEHEIASEGSWSGKGYMWASVYGANISSSDLLGTVTVEVYDANGILIASDSHTGTRTGYRYNYTYHGFINYDLGSDINAVTIGLFEGDSKEVLELFGESGILHITCTACSVSSASVISGTGNVSVTGSSGGYNVVGVTAGTSETTAGDATISVTVSKDNCKFHQYTEATAQVPVFVFKKPISTTTATTLTLTGNLDSRCSYYINGVEGTPDTLDGNPVIVFTGLTPNTQYQVEVRGKYTDLGGNTQYAYAWIYDTTKPIYSVTVYTYLNDVLMDIDDIHGADVQLYIGQDGQVDGVHIPLTHTATGTYTATANNGTYNLYHADSPGAAHHVAGTSAMVVNNANASMNVYHYSVGYNTGDGAFNAGEDPGTVNYAVGEKVIATDKIPVRAGYIFTGWQWSGGAVNSGATVTNSITAPITLTAMWEKAVSVTVNVTVDHSADNAHLDMNGAEKADVTVYLTEKKAGSDGYVRVGSFTYDVTVGASDDTTVHAPYVFTNMHGTSEFSVSVTKHNYDVKSITAQKDSDGNWTVNVELVYNFDDFDLEFEVRMDDSVPTELYPRSVNVRIQIFYDGAWHTIDQLAGNVPPIYVDISTATKSGSGSYPVWMHLPDGVTPAKYRIIVTSFTYADGTVVKANEQTAYIVYTDGNYTATMGDVADGELCGTVKGAYFDGTAQKGVLDAVVTLEKYDVTFDAQGGTVNGGATDVATDVYYIPAFSGYVPTRASYVFAGWYEDTALTVKATENKLLTSDITLYAKWTAVQTITGTVIVEGSYELGGNVLTVFERDRAKSVIVELMEIVGNAENLVGRQTVSVTYTGDLGTSQEFRFENLSEEKTYRIYVSVPNFDTMYQNEKTAVGTFNYNDYTAEFVADRTATFVNAHLDFVPEVFELPIKVDATAIGAGFRPANVIAQVLYGFVGTGEEFHVITQHTVAPNGVDVALGANGIGTDSEYVWVGIWDGTLCEYKLQLISIDGGAVNALPVYINYGSNVWYSPLNGTPNGELVAYIRPLGFSVLFDLNAGGDTVTGMEEYLEADGNYRDYHVWSFDTPITAEPEREGYIFKGWKLATPDATVYDGTKVLAAVAEDITLIAQWEARSDIVLTVEHRNKDTGYLIDTVTSNATFGQTINVADLKGTYAGYTYSHTDPVTHTVVLGTNLVTVYYTKDAYNYTVKYLEQGTNAVLAAETNGTAAYGDVVPVTAKAINGYYVVGSGSASITIDSEGEVYTFYYTKRTDMTVVIKYREYGNDATPINPDKTITGLTFNSVVDLNEVEVNITGFTARADNPDSYTVTEDGKVIILYYERNAVGYTVNYWYDGVKDTAATEVNTTAKFGDVITSYTDKPKAGYALDTVQGLPLTVSAVAASNVIDVYYVADTNDDGIPDKYQAAVTYKVLNGTWVSTANADPITVWFTLKEKNSDGVWVDVSPKPTLGATIPAATPDTGYDAATGTWHPAINAATEVSGNEVYVFTYGLNKYTVSASVENGSALNADNSAYSVKLVDHSTTETTTIYFKPNAGYAIFSIVIDGIAQDITPSTANSFSRTFDHMSDHHIVVVYDLDRNNDGIADKYQKRITFKVVNGTWSDSTAADKTVIVDLLTAGKYDVNGSGALTAPTGMIAAEGYVQASGAWDKVVPATVTGNTPETYTYTFADRKVITVKIAVENGTSAPAPSVTEFFYDAARPDSVVTFTPYANYILESVTVNGADKTAVFTGTVEHDFVQNWDIKVVYTLDENGDNIPDKYQKKVTFKVVNGKWSDNSTEIVKYVTVIVNGTPVDAPLDVPVSTPNSGYKGGSWDVTPPATVTGTEPVTYTFTYGAKKYADFTYKVEHYRQAADGLYYLVDIETVTVSNCELNAAGTAFEPALADVTAVRKDYGVHYEYTVLAQTKESGTPVLGEALTLKLYYKAKTYTVSYYIDDAAKTAGTVHTSATALYGTKLTVESAPHKTGYVFKGWKYSVDSSVKQAGNTYTVAGNAEFVGQWELQSGLSYKIQYLDSRTGASVKEAVIKHDATFGQSISYLGYKADIPGYTFKNAVPEDLVIGIDYTKNVITLYYDINTYKVSYELNGGTYSSYYAQETVNYNTVITVKDAPYRAGYSFTGWKANGVGYTVGQKHTVTDNITFEAQWTVRTDLSYTVYHVEKGTSNVIAPATTVGGKTLGDVIISANEAISIPGYTYDSVDKANLTVGADNAANVITLYYTKNTYTVSYDLNGATASGYGDESVSYNTVINVKNAPDYDGYQFAGWLANGTLYNSGDTHTVTENITFVAQWTYLNRVTVRYEVVPSIAGTLSKNEEIFILGGTNGTVNAGGVTVTPASGWIVSNWTDEDNNTVGYGNTLKSIFVNVSDGDVLVYRVYLTSGITPPPVNPDPVTPELAYYRVIHYKWDAARGVYDMAESEVLQAKIGDTVTAIPRDYEGYVLNPLAERFCDSGVVIENVQAGYEQTMLTLRLYYDINGGEDETPDIFQKKVIFRVVNGTWADGTSEEIVVYLDLLDADGKYSADGSAYLNAPAGMKANESYEGGYWHVTPPETVSGTDEAVFTYSFTKTEVPDVPVDPEIPDEPENPETGDSKVFLVAAMALASVFGIAKLGFLRREED